MGAVANLLFIGSGGIIGRVENGDGPPDADIRRKSPGVPEANCSQTLPTKQPDSHVQS